MSANKNMIEAKKRKNNEFYTKMEDIESEILNSTDDYLPQFKGKIIFCPCNDAQSSFYKFFREHFKELGIKMIIAAKYDPMGRNAYIRSFDGNEETINPISGTGGFESGVCSWILNDADIIVTNPPFSRLCELIETLEAYHKKYLLIVDKNCIITSKVFPLYMEGKFQLGHNSVHYFDTPNGGEKTFGNVGWITNLDVNIHKEPIALTKTYKGHESEYPTYDNFPAVNVDKVADIPSDCDYLIGVPVTIIEKDYEKQFEIVGSSETLARPVVVDGERHTGRFYIDGQRLFERIVIKKNMIPVIEVGKCSDIPKDFLGIMGVPISFLDQWDPNQFELIGVANHGSDNEFDLFPPFVNGSRKFPRVLIQRIIPTHKK